MNGKGTLCGWFKSQSNYTNYLGTTQPPFHSSTYMYLLYRIYSKKEQNCRRMSLSSSSQYDETKWQVKRLVTVNHTEAVSLMRGFFAGIAGIFGGPVDSMNQKMNDVTNALTRKLAAELGSGECMVGVHIQFAEFGRNESNTFLSGSAVGTILSPRAPSSPLAMSQGGSKRRQSQSQSRRHRR